jgi:acyl carrier protein
MRSEDLVRHTVADLLDIDEDDLAPDMRLANVEGWDSVNALRVLVYLERETGTALDYAEFARAATLADLARVVKVSTTADGGKLR